MKIGRYKIIETIKAGSFFKVYKAIQLPFERHVFLKEGRMNLPDNIIERFEREAHIAAFLNHPNIVKIYETFTRKEGIYHAFEWIEGFDLSKIMEIKGKIPEDIALLIIYEVLKALDYAHSKGIVHRDIKPSNIMISKEGFVKLTDFGVARWEDLPDITQPGIVIGTPHYLSPEQVKGEKPVPSSDIFSLGIVLYEMVFGEKPFKGEDTTSILLKIEKGFFSLPKGRKGKIVKIIKKALERDKEKRYRTAEEMMSDVMKFVGEKRIIKAREILSNFVSLVEEVSTTQTMERKAEPAISSKRNYLFLFFPFIFLFVLFLSLFLYYKISYPDLYIQLKNFSSPILEIKGLKVFYNEKEMKIPAFPPGSYRILCEDEKRFFLKDVVIKKGNSEFIIKDTLSDSLLYVNAPGEIIINSEVKDTNEYSEKTKNIPYFVEIKRDGNRIFRTFIRGKSKIYIDISDRKISKDFLKNLRIFVLKLFNL